MEREYRSEIDINKYLINIIIIENNNEKCY